MLVIQSLVWVLAILIMLSAVWQKQVPKGILEWIVIISAVLILIGRWQA